MEEDNSIDNLSVVEGDVTLDENGTYIIGEDGELIQVIDENVTEGSETIDTVFQEENLQETNDSFINDDSTVYSELIDDDSQIIEETIIHNNLKNYEDEDKENGQCSTPQQYCVHTRESNIFIQQEYADEIEGDDDKIVEITRRRISHEGNCYCGKDRNLNIVELLCASCHRWYHESCIGYQLGKFVPFNMNYVFICKNCSPTGLEYFKRTQAQLLQMCVTAIANLTQASIKEGLNRHKFSKDGDIIPFIDMHWEGMTPSRRGSLSWQNGVSKTLLNETELFIAEKIPNDPQSPYFSLLGMELNQIRPNYEAMINSGFLKLGELTMTRRVGAKRRTIDGAEIFAQSQAAIAKKIRGDAIMAKPIVGFGYPNEHPFNKDGYRYVLAEPDSNAPFRQEFDESNDWAGKPIPGWLYRVFIPPVVFLALHDRAQQLKVSEERLSVTGEKGYCTIRASHCVTRGCWYWEAKITELPESSACRIGWGQMFANLQAPLGFDKFGYSWRSRFGTKFHQAKGKTYCPGGYTLGDVLGFMIVLPEPQFTEKVSKFTPPSVPDSFKDRALVRFKSHLYYEDKDTGGYVDIDEIRLGSKIICFKNGECCGVAYEDIFEGSYYPSISLYKGCTVKANFGPNFERPPSTDKFQYKPFQDRAQEAIVEQTMSDILFLTENDGKLKLENFTPNSVY